MTDIIKSENNVPIRFADMGDGTYAEVTATNLFSSGANFNLIGDGKSLTSTGTSVSTLIPFDSTSLLAAGSVRVAVTDPGYIRIENTEAAASATDILVNPEDSILINTEGKRFISFVSLVGEATANIQPVGNNSFKMFESSLDLNFLSNEYVFNNDFVSFSSIATFSRNSAATFVGSNGLIQYAPANTPRFDYDPVTMQPRGLLVEEQRTNLLTFSEQFENAVWTKGNVTVLSNVALSPDGSMNADKLVEDATNNAHQITAGAGLVANNVYTASIFAKAGEREFLDIAGMGFTGQGKSATFNLRLGTVAVTGGAIASITPAANGFYRCSITTLATNTTPPIYSINVNGSNTYTGDGTSGIFVWGAQLELNAPTSYIPTTTAQATRLADSAKIDGANFAAFYKQSEGTIYAEMRGVILGQAQGLVQISTNENGSTLGNIRIRKGSAGDTYVGVLREPATKDIALTPSPPLIDGQIIKVALAVKTNDCAVTGGGQVPTTQSSFLLNQQMNTMTIGGSSNLGEAQVNGHIRRIMYIPKRLSNTELQALTI